MDIPLIANSNGLTIGKFITLFKDRRSRSSSLKLLSKVGGDITKLLLDVTDNFTLRSGGERITTFHQIFDEEVSQVTAGKIETKNGVWKCNTLIDGNSVGDTITRIYNDTGGTPRGVKRKNGLDRDIESGVLYVSNIIWVIFSRLTLELRGGSVKRTGCSSGATRNSL